MGDSFGDDLESSLFKIAEWIVERGLTSLHDTRAKEKARNRSLKEVASMCKYVYFDFSDWTYESLNPRTTSYVVGIPSGALRITVDDKEGSLESGPFSVLTGSDIVNIYKWCARQAPSGSKQRGFRFERGVYKGTTTIKNWQQYAIGGVIGGLILALAK